MAADYDRLFQGPDGSEAPDWAADGDYGLDIDDLGTDFDRDVENRDPNADPVCAHPAPPMPTGMPGPNGRAAPPGPHDRIGEPQPPTPPDTPPMPVDYDRLFEPDGGTIASGEPGAAPDYHLGDFATPARPPDAYRPNGHGAPPMPIHAPPTAPKPPAQAPDASLRHGRHSRRGPSGTPEPQPGQRTKSPNSHRAGAQRGIADSFGPPAALRPSAPSPETGPAEMRRGREPSDAFRPGSAQPVGERSAERTAPRRAGPSQAVADSIHTAGPADRRKVAGNSGVGASIATGQRAARMVPSRGWRRRVYALTRINVGLSRDEKYERELEGRIRRNIRGSYEIGVLGLKGGSGKTSATAALGSAFALVRGDRILAVDADPVSGNLADRVVRQTTASIADVLANRALSHYNDVRAHTSMNAVNLEVLAAADYNATRSRLSESDWKLALAAVPRFYNLVLADCGADLFGPAARGVLAAASGLVIVSSAAADSVRQVAVAAEWLGDNGYRDLLSRACVVINHVARECSAATVSDAARQFYPSAQPGRVIELPWDEHIATGAAVEFAKLSAAYRRKIIELAAALSDDFDRGERR